MGVFAKIGLASAMSQREIIKCAQLSLQMNWDRAGVIVTRRSQQFPIQSVSPLIAIASRKSCCETPNIRQLFFDYFVAHTICTSTNDGRFDCVEPRTRDTNSSVARFEIWSAPNHFLIDAGVEKILIFVFKLCGV